MSQVIQSRRIQLLPPQLADQIAAGEVVERPASVLKELLENALDAGASRIDIELQGGGMEGIRVTDNGHGIARDELQLAISRHATSKISTLDDLLHLTSLGFRGEALASICSISQWEITSGTGHSETAGQIRLNLGNQVIDANHPTGTTVSVQKLFYNTPARRKFLRAERTEFRHCDDVIRRMALARFDVGFYMRHNRKQNLRLPAVKDDIGQTRRVAQICGENFIHNALMIDYPLPEMRLWGWISRPCYSRQQSDLQYIYINGRIIRDRVISHAIRLAYQSVLPPGRHAAYVLYLELDPMLVDINVHPTKHEVRFRETRRVHDFIARSLRESFAQSPGLPLAGTEAVQETSMVYSAQAEPEQIHAPHWHATEQTLADNRITLLHDRYALITDGHKVLLIDLPVLHARNTINHWREAVESEALVCKPLLIPATLSLSAQQQSRLENKRHVLDKLGLDVTQSGPSGILLRRMPVCLQAYDVVRLLGDYLAAENGDDPFVHLHSLLLNQAPDCTKLLTTMNCDSLLSGQAEHREGVREITAQDLVALFTRSQ